jgi:MoxR-like ATPase
MTSGYCMAHDPSRAQERRAERRRGGTLSAARASLAAKKAEMVERYGLQAELPTLDSVEALGAYLAAVAARVESRQLSPAQGNTLVAVVKQSAALLGLSIDIKLASQLDALESR